MKVTITINGKQSRADILPSELLSDFLRAHGLWSVRLGCETGDCGSCAVLVDGIAVNSCSMLAVQADGKRIETFESVAEKSEWAAVQEVFMHHGDLDCGFCVPGFVMSIKALLEETGSPTVEEIAEALSGNICWCRTGKISKESILEAIRKLQGKW